MKNLARMLSLFLLLLCFACKKNNMPDLMDDASYLDSLRILDSINIINNAIMAKITEVEGSYCMTCKGTQTFYTVDSTGSMTKRVDTIFQDSLTIQERILFDYDGDTIPGINTIIHAYPYGGSAYFALEKHENDVVFRFPTHPSSCKCFYSLTIQEDSIYYHMGSLWNADSFDFDCKGPRKK